MNEHVDLSELIAEARKQSKWLHCAYQNLWFSPDDLEACNKAGRFRWGAVNWTLRDPKERIAQAVADRVAAEREEQRIRSAVASGRMWPNP